MKWNDEGEKCWTWHDWHFHTAHTKKLISRKII